MSIETDYATLRSVLHTYEPKDWAVEFGVYSGYSMAIIAAQMPVIGFDSFEGLPEDWREGFPKGTFGVEKVSLGLSLLPPANAMVVPGWFSDTVPTFPFPRLGLVHIDCDLYSSTMTALEGIIDYIYDGTIIVFDEFHSYPGAPHHEQRAFYEWRDRYGIEEELLGKGAGEHAQEIAFRLTQTRHV